MSPATPVGRWGLAARLSGAFLMHEKIPTTPREPMSTDAIVILKDDHQQIRKLFREFREFRGAGEKATATKGKLATHIIEELNVHTYLENEVMYPEVRRLIPELEGDVLESYEEHHVADVLSMELYAMKPDAERFDAKMSVLIENVTHH